MSRFIFRLAAPVVLAAAPAFAQGYYYAPSAQRPAPSYGYAYPPQQQVPQQQAPAHYYSQPQYPPQGYAPQPYPAQQAAAPRYDDAPALPPPARPAVDELEQMMWQAAASANTATAFSTYLGRYPDGAHSQQARAAMEQAGRAPQGMPAAAAAPRREPLADAPGPRTEAAAAALPPIGAATPVAKAPIILASVTPGGKPLPTQMVATAPVPVAPSDTLEPAAKPMMIAEAGIAKPTAPMVAVAAAPIADDGASFICHPVYASEAPYEQAADAEIGAYLAAIRMNSLGSYETYLQAYPHGTFAPEVAELIAARQGRMGSLAQSTAAGPAQARARAQIAPGEGDYPTIALRDSKEGKVTAIWEIAEDGCVEACRIDRSSGSAALDAATCRMVTTRGRYDPALSAQGKPVRSVDSATFAWKLPVH